MSAPASLDLARCRAGMRQIVVSGDPAHAERIAAIEWAIATIQRDPAAALSREYVGVKNYAHFGDQREDHGYGYGPRHGTIVFSIRRTEPRAPSALTSDAVYLLEAVRDFGTVTENDTDPLRAREYGRDSLRKLNLCDVLTRADRYAELHDHYLRALADAKVTSHAAPPARAEEVEAPA